MVNHYIIPFRKYQYYNGRNKTQSYSKASTGIVSRQSSRKLTNFEGKFAEKQSVKAIIFHMKHIAEHLQRFFRLRMAFCLKNKGIFVMFRFIVSYI